MRVSPFGNPRVNVYFQLTAAYRRLSRPSSALSAKAFTLRSFSLEQPFCFSPFCLTEIWNKFSFFAWASQIIVFWVVRSKKTLIFRSYVCLSASRFLLKPTKLFPLLLYGKTFIIFNNKFFSITTICFVSFLYSVFNEHLIGIVASASTNDMQLISHFVRAKHACHFSAFDYSMSRETLFLFGRPKWTRTTLKTYISQSFRSCSIEARGFFLFLKGFSSIVPW